jgi:hypothetical protein
LNLAYLDLCSASKLTFISNELEHLARAQHSPENFLGIPCGYLNILY